MLGDFSKFKKNNTPDAEIPQKVREAIAKELPKNLCIVKTEKGYMISPDPEKVERDGLTLKITMGQEAMDTFKGCPPEKLLTYSYNLQKPIPLKGAKIGDSEKQVPLEKTVVPLLDGTLEEPQLEQGFLIPPKFKAPFEIILEDEDGDHVSVRMQQQVYDSWEEERISNVDFPALTIDFYYNNNDLMKSRITYSVAPSKASTVEEALKAVRLFRGFLTGTTKINDQEFKPIGKIEKDFDTSQIDDVVESWQDIYDLEKKLKVSFDPRAKMTQMESKKFSEVCYSVIHDDFVLWKDAVSQFHVKGMTLSDTGNTEITLEDLSCYTKNEPMKYQYMEGPVDMKFMNAEFKVYCLTELENFTISKIQLDEGSKTDGTIYIKKIDEKTPILLKKKYITEENFAKETETADESGTEGEGQ